MINFRILFIMKKKTNQPTRERERERDRERERERERD